MATGYVIVDETYVAKRLGPEPAATTCTVGATLNPDPYLNVFADEIEACRTIYGRRLDAGYRLVVVDFDDPGDVTSTHYPAAAGDPWIPSWTELPARTLDVTDELDEAAIRAVVAANRNPAYP